MAIVIATICEISQDRDGEIDMHLSIPGDSIRLILPIAVTSVGGADIDVGDQVELDGPRETAHTARIRGYVVSKRDYRFSKHKFGAVARPFRT